MKKLTSDPFFLLAFLSLSLFCVLPGLSPEHTLYLCTLPVCCTFRFTLVSPLFSSPPFDVYKMNMKLSVPQPACVFLGLCVALSLESGFRAGCYLLIEMKHTVVIRVSSGKLILPSLSLSLSRSLAFSISDLHPESCPTGSCAHIHPPRNSRRL